MPQLSLEDYCKCNLFESIQADNEKKIVFQRGNFVKKCAVIACSKQSSLQIMVMFYTSGYVI